MSVLRANKSNLMLNFYWHESKRDTLWVSFKFKVANSAKEIICFT